MSTEPEHDDVVAGIVDAWRRERPDLDPSPLLVLGRLSRLGQHLDAALRPRFAGAGLASGDFDVLAALRRLGAPYRTRPVELSRLLMVTTGGITKRLDRLERQGLVVRDDAAEDGRGKVVALTDAGHTLVDRLIADHLANVERLLSGLTAGERDQLAALLGRLAVSLEA